MLLNVKRGWKAREDAARNQRMRNRVTPEIRKIRGEHLLKSAEENAALQATELMAGSADELVKPAEAPAVEQPASVESVVEETAEPVAELAAAEKDRKGGRKKGE